MACMNQLIGSYARQSCHIMMAIMRILNCKTTSSLYQFFFYRISKSDDLFPYYLNLARILIAKNAVSNAKGIIIYLLFLFIFPHFPQ